MNSRANVGSHRSASARNLAAAALALASIAQLPTAVHANELGAAIDHEASSAEGSGERPVNVRVGRALDLEGRAVYSGKSSFSDMAGITTFSTSPIRSSRIPAADGFRPGMPVSRAAITSGFGRRSHPVLGGARMHSGVDLAAPLGSPVVATMDGLVELAGWNGGYGLAVRLAHKGGLETRFGHLSKITVSPGNEVRRGEVIGYVGSTGRSTGPHLHYEMRLNGIAIPPRF